MFLIERDAAGGYADYFFQFILALLIAAPHCLDEAWLIFCDLLHLIGAETGTMERLPSGLRSRWTGA